MMSLLLVALVVLIAAIGLAWRTMRDQRLELQALRPVTRRSTQPTSGYDPLTGLIDREGLDEALASRRGRRASDRSDLGVVALDLSGFGQLNATLGRDLGDRLLVILAERLQSHIRSPELLARPGGDRFLVVLGPPMTPTGVKRAASRFMDCLFEPVVIDGVRLQLRANAGAAVGPGHDIQTVLDNAELALDRARRESSLVPVVYDAALRQAADATFHRAQHLRSAVEHGELDVAYQPILQLGNKRLASVEALLRWHSPTLGSVSPADFIPIAEDTGAIVDIGAWVLERACTDLGIIAASDPTVTVSVNVSVHQLRHPGFVDVVRTALSAGELDPHRLQLEVTESTLANPDEVGDNLDELRRLGVRIALDDVGTGYSSLSQLATLPIDVIKLDRSLLQPQRDNSEAARRVFRSLAVLGKSLGLDVIAEGVETEEQSEFARTAGCSHEQGFLRSRPIPLADAVDFAHQLATTQTPAAAVRESLRPSLISPGNTADSP